MQTTAALAAEWIVLVFIAAAGLIVLYKLYDGKISLDGLLSESPDTSGPGKASMSRLQLMLFTFVIAGLYLTLSLEAGYLIEIPNQVLGLLGISGASYVFSKGIQASK